MTDRPENSDNFFSARADNKGILSLEWAAAHARPVSHPFRYFVAAGESLAKIEEMLRDAKNRDADLTAFAQKYGATSIQNGDFMFPKEAATEPVIPTVRMVYTAQHGFYCDITTPGQFKADAATFEGRVITKELQRIETLPAAEADAARKKLESKYNATLQGDTFTFPRWQQYVKSEAYPKEGTIRLVDNPIFTKSERNYGFTPDASTPEGLKIAEEMSAISYRQYPQERFSQWVDSFRIDISLRQETKTLKEKTEAEKIGDEWIIKVPVVTEGIFGADGKGGVISGYKEGWVLPPGAEPIAVSEYFAKLEKAGAIRPLAKPPTP